MSANPANLTADEIDWHVAPEGDAVDSIAGYPIGVRVATRNELPFLTAAAIACLAPEQVEWIVPGFVAPGVVTEFDGKLKASGKTTLIAMMMKAVVTGARFLTLQTRQTPVVWLTEERAQTFAETLRRAQLDARTDIHVLHWHAVKALPWPVVMGRAADYALRIGAKLVVIDTISQWAAIRGDSENNNGSQMEAAAPLQAAAAKGLAVIVARHERKGGGDVGESGRGGSAFSGAVDIVVSIRRGEGKTKPTVRILQALSRFSETPTDLMIDLTPDGYVLLGDTASVATWEAEQAILDRILDQMPVSVSGQPVENVVATSNSDAALDFETLRTIEPAIGRTAAKAAIKNLFTAGKVGRLGTGKRGDPYRYFLSVKKVVATQTYGSDQQPETNQQPETCCDGGPLQLRCKLCSRSSTYWQLTEGEAD